MIVFSCLGFVALAAWLYLLLAHGMFWLPLLAQADGGTQIWPSVDIVVPARNEAEALPKSLSSLLAQDYAGNWRVILVDDHSTDGTAPRARQIATDASRPDRLVVIAAPDLPQGWSGKVAAMHAGVGQSSAELILFTDADIRHAPYSLSQLVAHMENRKLDLVSRMVRLHCAGFAEKLLIPAFVYFFAMLYPFRAVNNPARRAAAAAGGTMLIRRAAIDRIGGMASLKSALIDDCALAKAVKTAKGKIELTLTNDIDSLRFYPHVKDVGQMISRTAYTQLGYSRIVLGLVLIAMTVIYILPPLFFLLSPTPAATMAGLAAFVIMSASYAPMVRFYGLPWLWALTLPAAAAIYVGATLQSAWLYHQGKGGLWKGRPQA